MFSKSVDIRNAVWLYRDMTNNTDTSPNRYNELSAEAQAQVDRLINTLASNGGDIVEVNVQVISGDDYIMLQEQMFDNHNTPYYTDILTNQER